jgi:hypothetical protein
MPLPNKGRAAGSGAAAGHMPSLKMPTLTQETSPLTAITPFRLKSEKRKVGDVSLCVPIPKGYDGEALSPSRIDHSCRGLWSLWDIMHQFDASKFLAIATRLAQLNQQLVAGQWVAFPSREMELLKRDIANIKQQLKEMELDAAEISAAELFDTISQRGDFSIIHGVTKFSVDDANLIKGLCKDTVARAQDQLRSRTFLAIPLGMRDLTPNQRRCSVMT